MLGGIDPIIIFQFTKAAPAIGKQVSAIPLTSKIATRIPLPPIPIYLSENISGLFIVTESKNVDIDTDLETKTDGTDPTINQRGVASTVDINFVAKKGNLAIILLSSMIDLLFDKSTSKEYSVSYLHGPTTIFQAVLHSYNVDDNADNDLVTVKIQLSKGAKGPAKAPDVPVVKPTTGITPLTDPPVVPAA